MSVGRMNGNEEPTRTDVDAMKQWASLGDNYSVGGGEAGRTHSDGRIVISLSVSDAGREIEESVIAREKRHAEGQAKLIRSSGSALGLSHEQGLHELERDLDVRKDDAG